jgi:hypothetical protein
MHSKQDMHSKKDSEKQQAVKFFMRWFLEYYIQKSTKYQTSAVKRGCRLQCLTVSGDSMFKYFQDLTAKAGFKPNLLVSSNELLKAIHACFPCLCTHFKNNKTDFCFATLNIAHLIEEAKDFDNYWFVNKKLWFPVAGIQAT